MPFDHDQPVASFKTLLREALKGYRFNVRGLLLDDGSVAPLPRESSVIGKVVEVTIIEHLKRRLLTTSDLDVLAASSDRVYPDLTFTGSRIAPHRFGLDVKCARRNKSGKRTQSAISIGTFDAEYFHYPKEKVGNITMAYGDYRAHLALIVLYDYQDTTAKNVEWLIVEKWRVATRKRSSGTRCYIAATNVIDRLRREDGDFESEDEFNAFWRDQPINETKRLKWRARRGEVAG